MGRSSQYGGLKVPGSRHSHSILNYSWDFWAQSQEMIPKHLWVYPTNKQNKREGVRRCSVVRGPACNREFNPQHDSTSQLPCPQHSCLYAPAPRGSSVSGASELPQDPSLLCQLTRTAKGKEGEEPFLQRNIYHRGTKVHKKVIATPRHKWCPQHIVSWVFGTVLMQ